MFTKDSLRKSFSRDWKKHYELEIFREKGFVRKSCKTCGRHFWTLNPDREDCGDPPCQKYEFIGNPITKRKFDYIEAWREFEDFFKKNGHASVPRYPVIDRWRPDLFFTMASIQDFQRIDQGNMVFEYPAKTLVVPQVCLRFNDIPNVGVTGRHHTSFIMSGQHSFGGYWKDRCIELNFRFLTERMGIPEEELTYKEDLWAMPDFSAFGPSIETFSRGLELVNSVFMQFTKTGDSYKELPLKVIDVGWGHERLVWFSQGTHTGYDAVFGPVIKWMKKQAGFRESDVLNRYANLAGNLNIDEVRNIDKAREQIAKSLGISVREMLDIVEPMQAMYAIADHTKTLLFAVTDAGIPSNTGGGYNLRVLLRRAFSFLDEFGFPFSLDDIARLHAKHLHPLFPELMEGLDLFSKIVEIERERYRKTIEKARSIVRKELSRGRLNTDSLIKLYTSNGVTPEIVEAEAKKAGIPFEIPPDFYTKITDMHMVGEKEEEAEEARIDLSGMPETKLLYYEKPYEREFDAKVLKVSGPWVVLDRTLFYPEGGGQPGDSGILISKGKKYSVEASHKIGGVVVHKCKGPKEGDSVHGIIDWERRHQLMRMHTATHVVAGSARKVVGKHLWQAGAKKGLDISRIDLSHYKPFTKDEIKQIEKLANRIVSEDHRVDAFFMPRKEAEAKYGFVLYQGGASPGKTIRVVNVANGFDVEGCGGTHVKRTGEIELIKIIKTERIQDGVNRIEFACGTSAYRYIEEMERVAKETLGYVNTLGISSFSFSLRTDTDIASEVHDAAEALSVEPKTLPATMKRFCEEILREHEELNNARRSIGVEEISLDSESFIPKEKPRTLRELAESVFNAWKSLKKEKEKLLSRAAESRADAILKKERGTLVFDIIQGTRKELIETASAVLKLRPEATVILSNQAGDVVGMSNTKDMGKEIRELCQKAGGSGGGNQKLGQGKAELSKLVKIMGQ